jgi:hypothetical protein
MGNTSSIAAVSFSQSSPTLAVAQSLNVNIYGPTNSFFYVASNSNPSIVQANISGSVLTLLGIANGSSSISICVSSSNCSSLSVTVNANSSGGVLTLSQQSVSLSLGQTGSVTISGGAMPYSVLPTANSVFQATLNSNILTLYGIGAGSSLMNVCSSGGNCVTLSIAVGTSSSTNLPAGCYSTAGYSQTTGVPCSTIVSGTTLPAGCSSTMGYSQTTGVPCSSVANIITTVPTDCTGAVYSVSTGEACPASTVITTPVVVTTPTITTTPTPTTSSTFVFTKALKLGSTGTEVIQLQQKLKTLGFYKGKIDGGYGAATEAAVKALQKAHKLTQIGSVGPQTRALLNK